MVVVLVVLGRGLRDSGGGEEEEDGGEGEEGEEKEPGHDVGLARCDVCVCVWMCGWEEVCGEGLSVAICVGTIAEELERGRRTRGEGHTPLAGPAETEEAAWYLV